MSKKIKFTVFELLSLGGVALFIVSMLFFYQQPDALSALLFSSNNIASAAIPASAQLR